jgi:hypothetical protein
VRPRPELGVRRKGRCERQFRRRPVLSLVRGAAVLREGLERVENAACATIKMRRDAVAAWHLASLEHPPHPASSPCFLCRPPWSGSQVWSLPQARNAKSDDRVTLSRRQEATLPKPSLLLPNPEGGASRCDQERFNRPHRILLWLLAPCADSPAGVGEG